ncbi:MAG: hypothetical protein ABIK45_05300 [Pseudomonadota bacterium]
MNKKPNSRRKKSLSKTHTPLFTTPEVLRGLANALDTKSYAGKALDDYVRNGQYLHETHRSLIKEAVLDPLAKHLSSKTMGEINVLLNTFFRLYHEKIVLSCACADNTRQALGDAILVLCTPIVCDVVNRMLVPRGLPDLDQLIESQHPVGAAIGWLEANCYGWSSAVEKFKNQNSEKDNYIRRWSKGISLPGWISVVNLCTLVIDDFEREQAFILLVIARAIGEVMRSYKGLHEKVRTLLSADKEGNYDYSKIGIRPLDPSVAFREFLLLINDGHDSLMSDRRLIGIKPQIYTILTKANALHRQNKLPASSRWPLHLLTAHTFVAEGQLGKALSEYKKAYGSSLYAAGEIQINIINEALCVAAKQEDTIFLKKLKNQALAFNLLQPSERKEHDPRLAGGRKRHPDDFVEDWEIKHWKQQFHELFPSGYMFIDATEGDTGAGSPILILDSRKYAKPDFRNPDRVVKYKGETGGWVRKPQVLHFALAGDFRTVTKLISKGADHLTPWQESGDSLFHISIRFLNALDLTTPNDNLYHYLLPLVKQAADREKKENSVLQMVRTPFVKMQYSVLGSAVETSRPEVVQEVLDFGAPVDQRHSMDKMTPLYLACNIFAQCRTPGAIDRYIGQTAELMTSATKAEVCRRYGIPIDYDFSRPRHHEIKKAWLQLKKNALKNVNRNSLIAIAKILLKHGADPNAPHDMNRVLGRTPLMMAIEANDVELFELIIEHGGDTSLTLFSELDHNMYTCMDIAKKFGANAIAERMRGDV